MTASTHHLDSSWAEQACVGRAPYRWIAELLEDSLAMVCSWTKQVCEVDPRFIDESLREVQEIIWELHRLWRTESCTLWAASNTNAEWHVTHKFVTATIPLAPMAKHMHAHDWSHPMRNCCINRKMYAHRLCLECMERGEFSPKQFTYI